MTDVCLKLLAAPEIEEKLLDEILMSDLAVTFASQTAASHGGHPATLDASEQVMGRGTAVLITMLLDALAAEELITALRSRFKGTGLQYWLQPVLSGGEM